MKTYEKHYGFKFAMRTFEIQIAMNENSQLEMEHILNSLDLQIINWLQLILSSAELKRAIS